MVHVTDNITSSEDNSSQEISFNALETDSIQLPSNEFIADAAMTRDGQDLTLETPNGETVVIQNYFISEPAPSIETPNGSALTQNLVNSFLETPAEYAQVGSMVDESPVGAIEEMSGSATVTRADGSVEQLTLGTPIYNGDVVETSTDGAVNILFMDETSMAVSENARMAIDDYQYDPSTESGVTNLSVLKGVFVYTSGLIGRDDPDDVLIETPVGSIGIRGTIIAGHIKPDGESEITVVEGAIVVKNGSGEITLSDQFETVKVTGFNNSIEHSGVKSADDVSKSYGSVSDVAPGLFSSVNDSAKEGSSDKSVNDQGTDEAEVEAEKEAKAEEGEKEAKAEEEAKEGEKEAKEEAKEEQKVEVEMEVKDVNVAEAEAQVETISRSNDSKDHKSDNHRNGKSKGLSQSKKEYEEQLFVERDDLNKKPIDPNSTGMTSNHDLNGLIAEGSQAHIDNFIVPATFDLHNDGSADSINFLPNTTGTGSEAEAGSIQITDDNGIITINNPTPEPFDHFGSDAAFLGDFNGDGSADIIIGSPGNSWGSNNGGGAFLFTDTGADDYFTLAHYVLEEHQFGTSVKNLGDINGDGLTDVYIGSNDPNNDGYILLGNSTYITEQEDPGNDTILTTSGTDLIDVPDSGNQVLTGNGVGDMNGDGYDDFAIAFHTGGKTVETYVVYGNETPITDLSLSNLQSLASTNPEEVMQLVHKGALKSGNEYVIHAFGDADGDGFDDIQLGSVQSGGTIGEQYVIFGSKGDDETIIEDGDSRDTKGSEGVVDGEIGATANGDALVGDAAHYYDNAKTDLSMRGGDGDNIFHINSSDFRNIDGGAGTNDFIQYDDSGSSINFEHLDFEQISQVEGFQFGAAHQTITLTAENIFNFLRSSDTGEFYIEGINGVTNEHVVFNFSTSFGVPADRGEIRDNIATGLEEIAGTTVIASEGDDTGWNGYHYDVFEIGDYKLYIDQDVDVTFA